MSILAVRHLAEQRIKYDAIIAYDDLVAIGAIKFLGQNGITIPNDVAIIGFDNLPQAEYSIPALSSLDQPVGAIGQRSVELLLKHLSQQKEIEYVNMMPTLITRESTKTAII